jgi:hypothetical protein
MFIKTRSEMATSWRAKEMSRSSPRNPRLDIAETVRAACIQAALDGYESASISGLCAEGAFEAAISAIRMLDVKSLTEEDKNEKG